MPEILIVEDKKNLREVLKEHLLQENFSVDDVGSLKEAEDYLTNYSPDIIVLDIRLPDGNGLDLLNIINSGYEKIISIVMSAYGDIPLAVKAMKEGAVDFLAKPFDPDDLVKIIKKELKIKWLEREHEQLKVRDDKYGIAGNSSTWQKVLKLADKVSSQETTVLLIGETGSGKEVIARYIHRESDRSKAPFIPVNCAAIPKDLIESELFGAEPGAFTGISRVRIGKFEAADSGTIFLDEIADLSAEAQAKILRVLETKKIQRLGSAKIKKINVRIIAATNRDLQKDIKSGKFREDLYFRISVFPIDLPPLRDHSGDIRLLVDFFIDRAYPNFGFKNKPEVSESVYKILSNYQWPGNIRELNNVLERALILSGGSDIKEEYILLPDKTDYSFHEITEGAKEKKEKELILRMLDETGWNKTTAARKMGISYRTLLNKIKKFNLEKN